MCNDTNAVQSIQSRNPFAPVVFAQLGHYTAWHILDQPITCPFCFEHIAMRISDLVTIQDIRTFPRWDFCLVIGALTLLNSLVVHVARGHVGGVMASSATMLL